MASQESSAQPRPLQMGAKGAYIVRLLMVGDSACGKTSLVLRFDQNVFSTKFVTTIGVDYRDKIVKVCTSRRGMMDGLCLLLLRLY
jgi:Ras family